MALTTRYISAIYDFRATLPVDISLYRPYLECDLALVRHFVSRTESLIDVGCGPGWLLEALLRDDYVQIYGIDISRNSIEATRLKCDSYRKGAVELYQTDVFDRPPIGPFDAATSFLSCVGSFGSGEDARFLNSIGHLIRKGGTLLLTALCLEGLDALVGTTQISSVTTGTTIISDVTFERKTNSITITQHIRNDNDGSLISTCPTESMRLYSLDELISLIKGSTFCSVTAYESCKVPDVLFDIDRTGIALFKATR